MRRSLLVLMAIGVIAAADASPAAAGGSAFCIKGGNFEGGVGDCSFSSYQQCLATASGQAATCDANPFFNANTGLPAGRGLPRRNN